MSSGMNIVGRTGRKPRVIKNPRKRTGPPRGSTTPGLAEAIVVLSEKVSELFDGVDTIRVIPVLNALFSRGGVLRLKTVKNPREHRHPEVTAITIGNLRNYMVRRPSGPCGALSNYQPYKSQREMIGKL